MYESLQADLVALTEIMFINIVLSGDNAVVVGMAAAGVSHEIRKKVILWGMVGAVVLRILFALIATKLLAVVGLTLAGGILLLWVCWKMYRELAESHEEAEMALAVADAEQGDIGQTDVPSASRKTFRDAMIQIVIADVSMSLDNVLAVAGVAKSKLWVLVVGLLVSIALMGAAASLIAHLLTKHRWIAWAGLAIIVYVAAEMIWSGTHEVVCAADMLDMCERGLLGALWAAVPFGH